MFVKTAITRIINYGNYRARGIPSSMTLSLRYVVDRKFQCNIYFDQGVGRSWFKN